MVGFRDANGRLDPTVLRLMVITDGRGDLSRIERIVRAAVDGGARCFQLREPDWSARVLLQAAERLRPIVDAVHGVLLVNDRVDVAMTGVAHGVQIGHRSIPAAEARALLGLQSVLSFSAHDADELELAAAAGCDCALLSPVWPTTSKPGVPSLGVSHAIELTTNARLPVLWLGGVTAAKAAEIAVLPAAVPTASRPAGIAVRSAICSAADARAMTAELLRPLG